MAFVHDDSCECVTSILDICFRYHPRRRACSSVSTGRTFGGHPRRRKRKPPHHQRGRRRTHQIRHSGVRHVRASKNHTETVTISERILQWHRSTCFYTVCSPRCRKVNIENAVLYVRYVKLSSSVFLGHAKVGNCQVSREKSDVQVGDYSGGLL